MVVFYFPGWDLMWLATGSIVPSSVLLKELTEFLKTRTHPVAEASLNRLQKNLKSTPRQHPPYIIEVEAIQLRSWQIYHKVYFPDDTDEAFEIESSTKAKDLCASITKRLDLQSNVGFSLFVTILDKAFSVPEEQYIFDFICELVDWLKEHQPTRITESRIICQYQLFFMKKLWINAVPGRDLNADYIFYYPQEVPKYLKGYYNVKPEVAAKLGALIYRCKYGDDPTGLQQIQSILHSLIPEDLATKQKNSDWQKAIAASYNSLKRMGINECKNQFLKIVKDFPTFGSTFFVIKQSMDVDLPPTIIIAINRRGLDIIDPWTKDVISHYNFSDLNFWSSGNTYFQIRFGNMLGSNKLLCETTHGYKIDDLLSSYIKYLQAK